MAEFAPGMRVIIRNEEWMIKKSDINSIGNYTLQCIGISPLVKDKPAYFLSDLEKIEVVDPTQTRIIADDSAHLIAPGFIWRASGVRGSRQIPGCISAIKRSCS